MSNEDRILLTKLLQEISELRGEMKEFKMQTIYRLNNTEKRSEERQQNPLKCNIGRELIEHINLHGIKKNEGRTTGSLLLNAVMIITVIIIAIFK